MSLESLLIKVDESIWKQYEKVTNWAYKNYGWSKYDLMKACGLAQGISIFGVGVYSVLNSFNRSPPSAGEIIGGISLSTVGIALSNFTHKQSKQLEQSEMDLAVEGVATKPKFGIWNPLIISIYSSVGLSTHYIWFNSINPSQDYIGTLGEFQNIATALEVLYWGYISTGISFDYFSSQLPKPPKAKKSVWWALYEPITKRLHKAIPLPEPKSEGVKLGF